MKSQNRCPTCGKRITYTRTPSDFTPITDEMQRRINAWTERCHLACLARRAGLRDRDVSDLVRPRKNYIRITVRKSNWAAIQEVLERVGL